MKPSLQSTISKLATKISDVEFNGTALSNALAPLFDVKSPKRAIAATSLPPLPPPAPPPLTPPPPATAPKITYEFLDVPVVETRSPSPSEVTEDIGSSEWASSNESPDHKDGNGEEELLYGSYVGSKALRMSKDIDSFQELQRTSTFPEISNNTDNLCRKEINKEC